MKRIVHRQILQGGSNGYQQGITLILGEYIIRITDVVGHGVVWLPTTALLFIAGAGEVTM